MTLHFGGYDITILDDGVFEDTTDNLHHVDGPEALQRALAGRGSSVVSFRVQHYLLRGPAGTLLIDAGTGPGWRPALGLARAALAEAGVTPEAVDQVLLTHMHFDHSRGLLDGEAAYFPRATVVAPERDLTFFSDSAIRDSLPPPRRATFGITASIKRAYEGRIRTIAPGPVLPGIEAVALPGHTPGQVGYLLQNELLFWGDALHMVVEQGRDQKIGLTADLDPAEAARTRRAILERAVADNLLIAGSHIPGFTRVARSGGGFIFQGAS